jgi:hypothetical protein
MIVLCLDSTDEDYYEDEEFREYGFYPCYQDPAFRYEDVSHSIKNLKSAGSS